MTSDDLTHLIAGYRTGLEAEIELLQRLRSVSDALHQASIARDVSGVEGMTNERERVMAGLLGLEHDLQPTRRRLWEQRHRAAEWPAFQDVAALHRKASDLVRAIVTSDRETLQALQEADVVRRAIAQDIEVGETTLAAYRRIVAPSPGSAALMTRRG